MKTKTQNFTKRTFIGWLILANLAQIFAPAIPFLDLTVPTAEAAISISNVYPEVGSTAGGNSVVVKGSDFAMPYDGYYKTIYINNSSSNVITDLEIPIRVYSDTLISEGKMESDCSDVFVIGNDGITELPSYIEYGCGTSNMRLWTKIPTIPANASNFEIYVGYGDPTKVVNRDPESIFTYFFDNFDSYPDGTEINAANTNGKWTFGVESGVAAPWYAGIPPIISHTINPQSAPHSTYSNPIATSSNNYIQTETISLPSSLPSDESIKFFFWYNYSFYYWDTLYWSHTDNGFNSNHIGERSYGPYINFQKKEVTISTRGDYNLRLGYNSGGNTYNDSTYFDDVAIYRENSSIDLDFNNGPETPTTIDTTVTFDGTPGTNLTVVDNSTITITTPAHAAGSVDVVVNSNAESFNYSNGFRYANELTLNAVTPSSIIKSSGQTITVTGAGFEAGASTVKATQGASTIACGNYTTRDATTIVCDLDMTTANYGNWNIQVDNPGDGSYGRTNNAINVEAGLAQEIYSIAPTLTTTEGGDAILISGNDFLPEGSLNEITVTNSTAATINNALTKITLDTASLISNNKLDTSCTGLRIFESADLSNEIEFNLVSGCNTNNTIIDFIVPSLPVGNTTLYLAHLNHFSKLANASDNTIYSSLDTIPNLAGFWHFDEELSGSGVGNDNCGTMTFRNQSENSGNPISTDEGDFCDFSGNNKHLIYATGDASTTSIGNYITTTEADISAEGYSGNAASFDGSGSYYLFTDNLFTDGINNTGAAVETDALPPNEMTIGFWFKDDGNSYPFYENSAFISIGLDADSWRFYKYQSGGYGSVVWRTDDPGLYGTFYPNSAQGYYNDAKNKWHHLTIRQTGDNGDGTGVSTIFLNGGYIASGSNYQIDTNVSRMVNDILDPTIIGRFYRETSNSGVDNYFLIGDIDEMFAFGTALTDQQIADIYANGLEAIPATKEAYLKPTGISTLIGGEVTKLGPIVGFPDQAKISKWINQGELEVITSPNTIAGNYNVKVTNSLGLESVLTDGIYYGVSPKPVNVAPIDLVTDDTRTISITGTDFETGGTPATVSISRHDATINCQNYTVQTSTDITCDVDLNGAVYGYYSVNVTNPTSAATRALDEALYISLGVDPTITYITPIANVDELITIDGTNFVPPFNLFWNGSPLDTANFVFNAPDNIEVTVPPGSGDVDVYIENPKGENSSANPATFRYAIIIDSVTPNVGSNAGGTRVLINGNYFTGADQVTFDGVPGTDLIINSDTSLSVTTPLGTAGESVDIVISKPDGLVSTSNPQFTYDTSPIITKIEKEIINDETHFTIEGANFKVPGIDGDAIGNLEVYFNYNSYDKCNSIQVIQNSGYFDTIKCIKYFSSPTQLNSIHIRNYDAASAADRSIVIANHAIRSVTPGIVEINSNKNVSLDGGGLTNVESIFVGNTPVPFTFTTTYDFTAPLSITETDADVTLIFSDGKPDLVFKRGISYRSFPTVTSMEIDRTGQTDQNNTIDYVITGTNFKEAGIDPFALRSPDIRAWNGTEYLDCFDISFVQNSPGTSGIDTLSFSCIDTPTNRVDEILLLNNDSSNSLNRSYVAIPHSYEYYERILSGTIDGITSLLNSALPTNENNTINIIGNNIGVNVDTITIGGNVVTGTAVNDQISSISIPAIATESAEDLTITYTDGKPDLIANGGIPILVYPNVTSYDLEELSSTRQLTITGTDFKDNTDPLTSDIPLVFINQDRTNTCDGVNFLENNHTVGGEDIIRCNTNFLGDITSVTVENQETLRFTSHDLIINFIKTILPISLEAGANTPVTFSSDLFNGVDPLSNISEILINGVAATETSSPFNSPSLSAGNHTLTIRFSDGKPELNLIDKMTYYNAVSPVYGDIVPDSGNNLGGQSIVITGSNFVTTDDVPIQVFLGNTPADNVVLVDSNTINATVPNTNELGPVDVRIINPGGLETTSSNEFTYVPAEYGPFIELHLEQYQTYFSETMTIGIADGSSDTIINGDWDIFPSASNTTFTDQNTTWRYAYQPTGIVQSSISGTKMEDMTGSSSYPPATSSTYSQDMPFSINFGPKILSEFRAVPQYGILQIGSNLSSYITSSSDAMDSNIANNIADNDFMIAVGWLYESSFNDYDCPAEINYITKGFAPNRKFIIEANRIPGGDVYSSDCSNPNSNKFTSYQVKLFENNNVPLPSINSISGNTTVAAGTTTPQPIIIDGSNFDSVISEVIFQEQVSGERFYCDITARTENQLSCQIDVSTAPQGTYDIIVENNPVRIDIETSAFTIDNSPINTDPSITFVLPNEGSESGGTNVLIVGENFSDVPGIDVQFGGVSGTNITRISDTEIVATTPAGTGIVDVSVIINTFTTTETGGYSYLGNTPIANSFTPNTISENGGLVVINGDNFLQSGSLQKIILNNTSGASKSDQIIRLTFDTAKLINQGKMSSDCSDIRFYSDINMQNELPFYLQNCNTDSTLIDLYFATLKNGANEFYLFHTGLYSLTSASDITVYDPAKIPGLIGLWHFDETFPDDFDSCGDVTFQNGPDGGFYTEPGDICDSSGNGNHLIISRGDTTISTTPGIANMGTYVNDSNVDTISGRFNKGKKTGNSVSNDFFFTKSTALTDEMTYGLWIKQDSNYNYDATITYNPRQFSMTLYDDYSTERLNFSRWYGDYYSVTRNSSEFDSTYFPYTSTDWHHFAGTADYAAPYLNVSAYIDGKYDGVRTSDTSDDGGYNTSNEYPILFGKNHWPASSTYNNNLNATMDEAFLFGHTLSDDQIADIYNGYLDVAPNSIGEAIIFNNSITPIFSDTYVLGPDVTFPNGTFPSFRNSSQEILVQAPSGTGTASVTITNYTTDSVTTTDAITYITIPTPSIATVSTTTIYRQTTPNSITVTGTDFEDGNAILSLTKNDEPDLPCENYTTRTTDTITCEFDASNISIDAGNTDWTLTVTNPGTLESSSYTTPIQIHISPQATSVNPDSIPVGYVSNRTRTINGSGFRDDIKVYFGTTDPSDECTNVSINNEFQLNCDVPTQTIGTPDLILEYPGFATNTFPGLFTYISNPINWGQINPYRYARNEDTSVSLLAEDIEPGATVTINGVPATNLLISDYPETSYIDRITFTSPAGILDRGRHDIIIENPDGGSIEIQVFLDEGRPEFTYLSTVKKGSLFQGKTDFFLTPGVDNKLYLTVYGEEYDPVIEESGADINDYKGIANTDLNLEIISGDGNLTLTQVDCTDKSTVTPGTNTDTNGQICYLANSSSPNGTSYQLRLNNLTEGYSKDINLHFDSESYSNQNFNIANSQYDQSTYAESYAPTITETSDNNIVALFHASTVYPYTQTDRFALYAQKLDSSLNPIWPGIGTQIVPDSDLTYSFKDYKAFPDQSGGIDVFMTVYQEPNTYALLFQKIDSNGNPVLSNPISAPLFSTSEINFADYINIIPDNNGGYFVSFPTFSDTEYTRIYRLDDNRNILPGWPIQINDNPLDEKAYEIHSMLVDSSGNLKVLYLYNNESNNNQLKVRTYSPNGTPIFNLNNPTVSTANATDRSNSILPSNKLCDYTNNYNQDHGTMIDDGNNGVYVIFYQSCKIDSEYIYQIYINHIPSNASGENQWSRLISEEYYYDEVDIKGLSAISDGNNGVTITYYMEQRIFNFTTYDRSQIYFENISNSGGAPVHNWNSGQPILHRDYPEINYDLIEFAITYPKSTGGFWMLYTGDIYNTKIYENETFFTSIDSTGNIDSNLAENNQFLNQDQIDYVQPNNENGLQYYNSFRPNTFSVTNLIDTGSGFIATWNRERFKNTREAVYQHDAVIANFDQTGTMSNLYILDSPLESRDIGEGNQTRPIVVKTVNYDEDDYLLENSEDFSVIWLDDVYLASSPSDTNQLSHHPSGGFLRFTTLNSEIGEYLNPEFNGTGEQITDTLEYADSAKAVKPLAYSYPDNTVVAYRAVSSDGNSDSIKLRWLPNESYEISTDVNSPPAINPDQIELIATEKYHAHVFWVQNDDIYANYADNSPITFDWNGSTGYNLTNRTTETYANPKAESMFSDIYLAYERTDNNRIILSKIDFTNASEIAKKEITINPNQNQSLLDLALDSNANPIILFRENNSGNIYIQKLNSNLTNQLYGDNGIKVSDGINDQHARLSIDSNDNIAIAWEEYSDLAGTSSNIAAKVLSSNGEQLWNKVLVSDPSESTRIRKNIQILDDEYTRTQPNTGFHIVFEDWNGSQTEPASRIISQRVVNGELQRSLPGNIIADEPAINSNPSIAKGSDLGLMIAWQQENSPADIYTQYESPNPYSQFSTLATDLDTLNANGVDQAFITATVKDLNDNPLIGHTIEIDTLFGNTSGINISPTNTGVCSNNGAAAGISDSEGEACFIISATESGTRVFMATDISSAPDNYTIPQTVAIEFLGLPTAPTITEILELSQGVIKIYWEKPLGDETITDYAIRYGLTSDATCMSNLSTYNDSNCTQIDLNVENDLGSILEHAIAGLTTSEEYRIVIIPINGFGDGAPSAPTDITLTETTPATIPDQPILSGVPGNQLVTLNWSVGSDGNSPLTKFLIKYGNTAECDTTELSTSIASPGCNIIDDINPLDTTLDVTGLTNLTDYRFVIFAYNFVGESPASNPTVAITPQDPDLDNDTIPNGLDNCPLVANPGQENANILTTIALTNTPTVYETSPDFSPDDSLIVYDLWFGGLKGIYTMNAADGSNKTQISSVDSSDYTNPTFSRDGSKIIYIDFDGNNNADLYSMDVDGSNVYNITGPTLKVELQEDYTFTPDGSEVIFSARPDTDDTDPYPFAHIYRAALDGSSITALTFSGADYTNPVMSRDGRKIAYFKNYYTETEYNTWLWTKGVYIMDANGSNKQMVISDNNSYGVELLGAGLSINPDGSKIVFYAHDPTLFPFTGHGDNEEDGLYIIDSDGTDFFNLDYRENYKGNGPLFSPDGNRIAFTALWHNGSGLLTPQVNAINIDGTGLIAVAGSVASQGADPSWRSDSQGIAAFGYNGLEANGILVTEFTPGDACDCNSDGQCTAAQYCADNLTPDPDCPPVAPAPPEISVTSSAVNSQSVWTVPVHDGGSAITGYTLVFGPSATCDATSAEIVRDSGTPDVNCEQVNSFGSSTLTYNAGNLSLDTEYAYFIYAENAIGFSNPGTTTDSTSGLPDPPPNPTFTRINDYPNNVVPYYTATPPAADQVSHDSFILQYGDPATCTVTDIPTVTDYSQDPALITPGDPDCSAVVQKTALPSTNYNFDRTEIPFDPNYDIAVFAYNSTYDLISSPDTITTTWQNPYIDITTLNVNPDATKPEMDLSWNINTFINVGGIDYAYYSPSRYVIQYGNITDTACMSSLNTYYDPATNPHPECEQIDIDSGNPLYSSNTYLNDLPYNETNRPQFSFIVFPVLEGGGPGNESNIVTEPWARIDSATSETQSITINWTSIDQVDIYNFSWGNPDDPNCNMRTGNTANCTYSPVFSIGNGDHTATDRNFQYTIDNLGGSPLIDGQQLDIWLYAYSGVNNHYSLYPYPFIRANTAFSGPPFQMDPPYLQQTGINYYEFTVSYFEDSGLTTPYSNIAGNQQITNLLIQYAPVGGNCSDTDLQTYDVTITPGVNDDCVKFQTTAFETSTNFPFLDSGDYRIAAFAIGTDNISNSSTVETFTVREIDGKIEIHHSNDTDETGTQYTDLTTGRSPFGAGISNGNDVANLNDINFSTYDLNMTKHTALTSSHLVGAEIYGFDEFNQPIYGNIPLNLDSVTTSDLDLSDDGLSANIPLGFNTRVYGKLVNTIRVSSNGFIYLNSDTDINDTSSNGCCSGYQMESQYLVDGSVTGDILIAGNWTDLNPTDNSGVGDIKVETFGTSPNRHTTVSFENIPYYGTGGTRSTNFQIKIFETDIRPPDAPTWDTYTPASTYSAYWNEPVDPGSGTIDAYRIVYGYEAPIGTCTVTDVVEFDGDLDEFDSNYCFTDDIVPPDTRFTAREFINGNSPNTTVHLVAFARNTEGLWSPASEILTFQLSEGNGAPDGAVEIHLPSGDNFPNSDGTTPFNSGDPLPYISGISNSADDFDNYNDFDFTGTPTQTVFEDAERYTFTDGNPTQNTISYNRESTTDDPDIIANGALDISSGGAQLDFSSHFFTNLYGRNLGIINITNYGTSLVFDSYYSDVSNNSLGPPNPIGAATNLLSYNNSSLYYLYSPVMIAGRWNWYNTGTGRVTWAIKETAGTKRLILDIAEMEIYGGGGATASWQIKIYEDGTATPVTPIDPPNAPTWNSGISAEDQVTVNWNTPTIPGFGTIDEYKLVYGYDDLTLPTPQSCTTSDVVKFYGGEGACTTIGYDPDPNLSPSPARIIPGSGLFETRTFTLSFSENTNTDVHFAVFAKNSAGLWSPASDILTVTPHAGAGTSEGAIEIHLADGDDFPIGDGVQAPSLPLSYISGITNQSDDPNGFNDYDFTGTPTQNVFEGAERYNFINGNPNQEPTKFYSENMTADPDIIDSSSGSLDLSSNSITLPLGFYTKAYDRYVDTITITAYGNFYLHDHDQNTQDTGPPTPYTSVTDLNSYNSTQYIGSDLTGTNDPIMIAGRWQNYNTGQGENITWAIKETDGLKRFVLDFQDFELAGSGGVTTDFQIKIFEDGTQNLDIPLTIFDINPAVGPVSGGISATIQGQALYEGPSGTYREVEFTNAGPALTDHQVFFNIDGNSLITSGDLAANCANVRVYEIDGSTPIPYWVQPGTCNTNTTKVWIKTDLPANSTKKVILKYDNLADPYQYLGEQVFEIYEGFQTDHDGSGTVDINDMWAHGWVQRSTGAGFTYYAGEPTGARIRANFYNYRNDIYWSPQTFNKDVVVEFDFYEGAANGANHFSSLYGFTDNVTSGSLISRTECFFEDIGTGIGQEGNNALYWGSTCNTSPINDTFIRGVSNGNAVAVQPTIPSTTYARGPWRHGKITWSDTSEIFIGNSVAQPDIEVFSATTTDNIPDTPLYLNFGSGSIPGLSFYLFIDDIFVRKHAPNNTITHTVSGELTGSGISVNFNGAPAGNVTHISNNEVTLNIPASNLSNDGIGFVDVTLTNGLGDSYTLTNGFEYIDPKPTLTVENVDDQTIDISWTAPTGIEPITRYLIYYGESSGTCTLSALDSLPSEADPLNPAGGCQAELIPDPGTTSHTFTNLTNETDYHFKVYAEGIYGWSSPSNLDNGTPSSTSITAPPKPSLNTNPGNAAITVNWDPISNGGSPITGFILRWGESSTCAATLDQLGDGACTEVNISDPADRSDTFVGLTNETEYSFMIWSVNAIGTSPASDPATTTPSDSLCGSGLPGETCGTVSIQCGAAPIINTGFSNLTFDTDLGTTGIQNPIITNAYQYAFAEEPTFTISDNRAPSCSSDPVVLSVQMTDYFKRDTDQTPLINGGDEIFDPGDEAATLSISQDASTCINCSSDYDNSVRATDAALNQNNNITGPFPTITLFENTLGFLGDVTLGPFTYELELPPLIRSGAYVTEITYTFSY